MKKINIKIVRPSIITATYFDPLPGYTDNVYGLNGVLVGAGVGVLRILRIDNKLKSNIVPADYVINLILASSCYNLEKYEDYLRENFKGWELNIFEIIFFLNKFFYFNLFLNLIEKFNFTKFLNYIYSTDHPLKKLLKFTTSARAMKIM